MAERSTVVRLRDLEYGQRFATLVSGRKVLVEVVYVRRKSVAGDKRIVLRRADTKRILEEPRALVDLLDVVQ